MAAYQIGRGGRISGSIRVNSPQGCFHQRAIWVPRPVSMDSPQEARLAHQIWGWIGCSRQRGGGRFASWAIPMDNVLANPQILEVEC